MIDSGTAHYLTAYERPELLIGTDRTAQTAVLMCWHDQVHQLADGNRLAVSDTSTGRFCVAVELHGHTRRCAERDLATLGPLMHAHGWDKVTRAGREMAALLSILPDALESGPIVWLDPDSASGPPDRPA